MKNPEVTGKRPASIAGRVLAKLSTIEEINQGLFCVDSIAAIGRYTRVPLCSIADFKTVLASALTQAEDKKGKR